MTKTMIIKGREIAIDERMQTIRMWGNVEGLRPGDLATVETYDVSGDKPVLISVERVTVTQGNTDFWARAMGPR